MITNPNLKNEKRSASERQNMDNMYIDSGYTRKKQVDLLNMKEDEYAEEHHYFIETPKVKT